MHHKRISVTYKRRIRRPETSLTKVAKAATNAGHIGTIVQTFVQNQGTAAAFCSLSARVGRADDLKRFISAEIKPFLPSKLRGEQEISDPSLPLLQLLEELKAHNIHLLTSTFILNPKVDRTPDWFLYEFSKKDDSSWRILCVMNKKFNTITEDTVIARFFNNPIYVFTAMG